MDEGLHEPVWEYWEKKGQAWKEMFPHTQTSLEQGLVLQKSTFEEEVGIDQDQGQMRRIYDIGNMTQTRQHRQGNEEWVDKGTTEIRRIFCRITSDRRGRSYYPY